MILRRPKRYDIEVGNYRFSFHLYRDSYMNFVFGIGLNLFDGVSLGIYLASFILEFHVSRMNK
jgi:hypothetical protein